MSIVKPYGNQKTSSQSAQKRVEKHSKSIPRASRYRNSMNRKTLTITAGARNPLSSHGIDGSQIKRIWTVYDSDFDPLSPLKHNEGVFLEEMVHDWQIVGENELYYYSRVVKMGQEIPIIIEMKG